MTTIKAGDKVRVVKERTEYAPSTKGQLLKGSIHTVQKVSWGVELEGADHEGYAYTFDRFELVGATAPKLNRKHGIEVGSKVRVISSQGSSLYRRLVGLIVTVDKVEVSSYDDCDLIHAGGVGGGQYPTRFELVPEANGVDKDGNPKHFTRDDLKSLMRVVLENGAEGIIAENGFGSYGVCVVYDTHGEPYGSFDPAYIEPTCNYPLVVEVYENPGHGNMYKQGAKGDLIWKSADAVKAAARKEAEAAVEEAVAATVEANAKLAAASAALAAL